jgi:hypothetical protein
MLGFSRAARANAEMRAEVERLRLAIGRMESRRVREATLQNIQQAEFQVFSQWGEDGIIQYLLGKVAIENSVFVEFGVQDYSESNTRFLLCNDNWAGLIIDSGTDHQRFVRERNLAWKHTIDAVSSFVTRENINALIGGAGIQGDIGLLSIDIDGNDYWLMEAIEVISPRIVIVEYNSHFGPDHAITIPYSPLFDRRTAHDSMLYWGASLPALCHLAKRKGYALVGSNSAGSNAFFVRTDVLGPLRALSPREGFVMSRFRESRDGKGRLSYVTSHSDRLRLISELPVLRIPGSEPVRIGDLFGITSPGSRAP